jgi:hypothetical protein
MDMKKIEKLSRTPRPLDETVQKIWKRPLLFRGRWEREMAGSPLVFLYVVQAHQCLFEKGAGELAPAVLLYTTDPAHCLNTPWLADLAERISALETSGTDDPKANELGCYLAAEDSSFDLPVPMSLTGGVAATIRKWSLSTWVLPDKHIGPDRIIPALVCGDGHLIMIPGELYSE